MIAQLLYGPRERAATVQQQGHPAAGVIGWLGGSGTVAGIRVDEDTALNYSACWAATRLLCATGGRLPLNLHRRLPNERNEVATDHATHRIIHRRPNPQMSGKTFRMWMLNNQINRGNAYAEIERTQGGRGVALHPIHPTRVTPRIVDGGNLVYDVTGGNGAATVRIESADMFHVRSIITSDGVVGKGVIQNARESIGFGIATERHGAAFFGNGARPNVVVTHPGKLSSEARQNFRREWKEIHGGPDKAGDLALLQEGAKVELMNVSSEDSQFLQTRQHNVEEVARWYGVPPHMLGHLLRSTFNNIEHLGLEFVRYGLLPWLELWEEEIDFKLLSEREQDQYYSKHVVEALLRGDSAARAAFYTQMFGIGGLSINEILKLEDRNPIGSAGDKRFVPLNMTTIEKAGKEPESEPLPPPAEPADEPDDNDEKPSSDAENPLPRIQAATLAALQDVYGLMIRKETEGVQRATREPSGCLGRIHAFYEQHRERMAKALRPPLVAYLVSVGREPDGVVEVAVEQHIAESRRQLLAALECQPEELAASVERCVGAWGERTIQIVEQKE